MSTVPAVVEAAELRRMETEGDRLLRSVRDLVVTDPESHALAADYAKLGAGMEKAIHQLMDPLCAATDHAHRVAVAQRAALLQRPVEVKRLAGTKATEWERAQERLRREAEEARRVERERLEREERERVAAERLRLQREAEERQLAEALAKEAAGDTQAMERILHAPPEVAVVTQRPVFVPPVSIAPPPKAQGLSWRMDWDFEVEDEMLIPREYLKVDDVAIRRVCKSLKGKTRIPGIRAVEKPVTSTRA